MSMRSALVVSAHSADFVWRCGGAIALHQEKGVDVTVVCLSYGERGESAKLWKEQGMTLEAVKAGRRREAENAAGALGAHDIQFFDLGDYPLEMDREAKFRLVDVIRKVQPAFMLSHSLDDPYNTDHLTRRRTTLECRMVAQAWGHNPGEKVLGAPQLYLFEPHQTEQCGWKPDTILDITPVWEKKKAAIECMEGQQHLWHYYTNVAENRGNQFRRNSGGQAGGREAKYARGLPVRLPQNRGRTVMSGIVVRNIERADAGNRAPSRAHAASRPCTRRRGAGDSWRPACRRSIPARRSARRRSPSWRLRATTGCCMWRSSR